jgi:hypothetical protein
MTLTDEQIAIVQASDVDVAVSAGAGTGKTHVLVERYVHLLQQCTIPEIVAITFTEAAAAEMRQRVRLEVMQRPELAHHRAFVDEAMIGTIHSLCLRLLREYPVEAGLDPGAEILAEGRRRPPPPRRQCGCDRRCRGDGRRARRRAGIDRHVAARTGAAGHGRVPRRRTRRLCRDAGRRPGGVGGRHPGDAR